MKEKNSIHSFSSSERDRNFKYVDNGRRYSYNYDVLVDELYAKKMHFSYEVHRTHRRIVCYI